MLRIQCITVDAHDPARVAQFWAEALGWTVTHADDIEVSLELKDGSALEGNIPDLLFIRVPDDKAVKNRLHLDLRPADQAAEVLRLESLGATKVDIGQSQDSTASWVVMADPEGNEFCVLRAL